MSKLDLQQLAKQAESLFGQRHGSGLEESESFQVRISRFQGLRRVEVSLYDDQRSRLLQFFADVPGMSDQEAIYLGLDFLDGVLTEFFETERDVLPPLDPTLYRFENQDVYLSGELRRLDLEAEADALLAQHGFEEEEDG